MLTFRYLRPLLWACVTIGLLSTFPADAWAQKKGKQAKAAEPDPAAGLPFGDPQKFFEAFMGKPNPDDDEALESIEVSAREEQDFGQSLFETFERDMQAQDIRLLGKGKDVEYLQALVAQLRPFMQNQKRYKKIRLYVAESPRIEAICFAGGTIVVFRGMLNFVENEAALVGMLGHELSHLDHGHILSHVRRFKLMQRTFNGDPSSFTPDQFFSQGTQLMRLWMQPFRPQDEAAADLDGAEWMHRAGYDTREMAALFLRMHKKRPGQNGVPAFFRTHPFDMDRYHAILGVYNRMQKDKPLDRPYIGRENLKRRIPRTQQEFP